MDAQRFEEFFTTQYSRIVGLFRRRGFSMEESRELAQETFMAAYRSDAINFEDVRKFRTWIATTAKRIALNAIRARHTQKRSAHEISLADHYDTANPEQSGPLDEVLLNERSRALAEALEALPPRMKQCLVLRQQGLKYREISGLMGVTIGTVKALLSAARGRLQDCLGPYFDLEDLGDEKRETAPASTISHNIIAPEQPLDLTQVLAETHRGTDLVELTESFLAGEHAASMRTSLAYRRHLREFLQILGGSPLTADALRTYRGNLLSNGRGTASHRQALAAVRGFLDWLGRPHPQLLQLSPREIRGILKAPPAPERPTPAVTADDAPLLVQRAPTARDRAMLSLFLGGGLRVDELVRVNVQDFQHRGSGLSVTIRVKATSRSIPLSPEVERCLASYLAETGRSWLDQGPLFIRLPTRGGRKSRSGALTTRAVQYRIRKLLEIAGLADKTISPHSLRKAYASQILRESGGDLMALQKLLGHVSPQTTERFERLLAPASEQGGSSARESGARK